MLQPCSNEEFMYPLFYALEGPAVHAHPRSPQRSPDWFPALPPVFSSNTNTLYQSLPHQKRGPQYCWAYFWQEMVQLQSTMSSQKGNSQMTPPPTSNTPRAMRGGGVFCLTPRRPLWGCVLAANPVRQPSPHTTTSCGCTKARWLFDFKLHASCCWGSRSSDLQVPAHGSRGRRSSRDAGPSKISQSLLPVFAVCRGPFEHVRDPPTLLFLFLKTERLRNFAVAAQGKAVRRCFGSCSWLLDLRLMRE